MNLDRTLIMTDKSISFPGFAVDKLGTYEPAFFMAGGALIAASLTPWVLGCFRDRKTEKIEISLEDYVIKNDT